MPNYAKVMGFSYPIQITSITDYDVHPFTAAVPEVTQIDIPADLVTNAITTGDYFLIHTIDTDYKVWFNVDGGGGEPVVASTTAIEVAILSTDNQATVATKLAAALAAYPGAVVDNGTNVTVTNTVGGACTDAATGAGLPTWGYTITQQGVDSIAGTDLGAVTPGAYMVRIVGTINKPREQWQRGAGTGNMEFVPVGTEEPVDIVVNKARVESVWSV
jgi:hypothetical protein